MLFSGVLGTVHCWNRGVCQSSSKGIRGWPDKGSREACCDI